MCVCLCVRYMKKKKRVRARTRMTTSINSEVQKIIVWTNGKSEM